MSNVRVSTEHRWFEWKRNAPDAGMICQSMHYYSFVRRIHLISVYPFIGKVRSTQSFFPSLDGGETTIHVTILTERIPSTLFLVFFFLGSLLDFLLSRHRRWQRRRMDEWSDGWLEGRFESRRRRATATTKNNVQREMSGKIAMDKWMTANGFGEDGEGVSVDERMDGRGRGRRRLWWTIDEWILVRYDEWWACRWMVGETDFCSRVTNSFLPSFPPSLLRGGGEGEFKYELESKQRTTFRPCLRQSRVDFNSIVFHLFQIEKKESKINYKNVYQSFQGEFEQCSKNTWEQLPWPVSIPLQISSDGIISHSIKRRIKSSWSIQLQTQFKESKCEMIDSVDSLEDIQNSEIDTTFRPLSRNSSGILRIPITFIKTLQKLKKWWQSVRASEASWVYGVFYFKPNSKIESTSEISSAGGTKGN